MWNAFASLRKSEVGKNKNNRARLSTAVKCRLFLSEMSGRG